MPSLTPDQLYEAERRGIISADQRQALQAMAAESAPAATRVAGPEAPRGLNWVSVAYGIGAFVVLAAFAWFLAERWRALGPGGTLVVAVVYAALFAVAARVLFREGFRTAGGLATLLVVGMTPVTAWALLSLLDLWPVSTPGWGGEWMPAGPWNASGWLAVDLTVILAALLALRRVRFALLALPIAMALGFAGMHLSQALFVESETWRFMSGWAHLVSGTVILAIGYALDRRRERATGERLEDDEDFARWFYVVGLVVLQIGLVEVWGVLEVGRHWLPAVALLQIAAALQLRRRSWLAAGAANVAWYVGFLAADVFRELVSFPVMLASAGAVLIIGTVLVQRRFPQLVRRLDADRPGWTPEVTGNWVTVGGVVAIALALYLAGAVDAPDRLAEDRFQQRIWMLRSRNEAKWGPPRQPDVRRPRTE